MSTRTIQKIINISFKVSGIKENFDSAQELMRIVSILFRLIITVRMAMRLLEEAETAGGIMAALSGNPMGFLLLGAMAATSIYSASRLGVTR